MIYNQLQMSRYQPKLSKQATLLNKNLSLKMQAPQSYRGLTLKQYFQLESLNDQLKQIEEESQSELENQLKSCYDSGQKQSSKKLNKLPKQSFYVKSKLSGQNSRRLQLKKYLPNQSMTERQENLRKNEFKLPSIVTHSISPSLHSKHNSHKQANNSYKQSSSIYKQASINHKQAFMTHKRIRTEIMGDKNTFSSNLPEVKANQASKVTDKLADKLVMMNSKSNQSLKMPIKGTIETSLKAQFFLTFSKLKLMPNLNIQSSNSTLHHKII